VKNLAPPHQAPPSDTPLYKECPENQLAFSPGEFARLLGKSTTWGYRRVWDQSVRVVNYSGRLLIPRTEIERFLGQVTAYDGEIGGLKHPEKKISQRARRASPTPAANQGGKS
jgi:hypothetical protein